MDCTDFAFDCFSALICWFIWHPCQNNGALTNYYRNKLAPHVRAYSRKQLEKLFKGLPVKFVHRAIIFGAYDNIIARHPGFGNFLRKFLQFLEKTPFKVFGLSHFWVVEKLN